MSDVPRGRPRGRRRAQDDPMVALMSEIPPGYEPETWDVVREDGMVIVPAVLIAVADSQCAYLNAHSQGHSYEVRNGADR